MCRETDTFSIHTNSVHKVDQTRVDGPYIAIEKQVVVQGQLGLVQPKRLRYAGVGVVLGVWGEGGLGERVSYGPAAESNVVFKNNRRPTAAAGDNVL